MARSSRASVRSRPSATSVSNSGGVAVRPVTATRMAMNRSPAFQPRASASARSGGSSSSASKVTAPVVGDRPSRAAASAVAGRRGVPALGHEHRRRRRSTSSTHRKPTRSPIAPSVGRRSRTIGSSARSSSSDGHPVDPAGDAARPRRTAAGGRPGRPASSRRIHWPLSHSSRSRSKTAPPLWTASSSKRSTISSSDRTSSSVPGRPAEEREVVDERLADEALRRCSPTTAVWLLRLLILRPVRVEDERQVGEERDRVAERPEQQDVLGRVREVVLAADDVADLHRRVVDDHREVVERRAVGADDDEVAAEVGDVDLDAAADDVVEGDDARRRPGTGARRGGPRPRGRRARRASGARSGRRSAAAAWPPPGPCGRRRAPRACSSRDRPGRRRAAARRRRRSAAAAPSGGTGAYGPRAASPATSGPSSQCRPSQCRPSRMSFSYAIELARLVRVLEAQDERAAGVPREQVVEQRRPGGPDVERAGRARGDPDARSTVGHRRRRRAPGRRWNRAGSASPGRTRTSAAGRRPSVARPRGPSSVSESSDSLRARIVTWAPGRQRARLEVRQQAGVLLGLLGDPVDRRAVDRPRSRSGGCPAGRRRAVSASIGLPCGQVSGCPSISSRRASTRGEIAPWRRIASSSDSAQPSPTTEVSSHSSSAWRRKMRVRGGPAGRREVQVAALGVGDQAVGRRAGGTSRSRPGW